MENRTKKCKYCQSEIDIKARICPVCKRPVKTHGCLISIVIVLFMLLGVLSFVATFAQPADDKYITLEEFSQIKAGMTYEQVQEIVGGAGTVTADSALAGIRTTIVTWYANPSIGSNANVTFQNNAVVSKAQIGLQ